MLTKDLADVGIGIVINQPIYAKELLVALWPDEDDSESAWFFVSEVRRNAQLGGGFWILGVELTSFANEEYQKVLAPLLPLAKRLRAASPVCVR